MELPIKNHFSSSQTVASNLEVWVPRAHGDASAQMSPPNRPGGFRGISPSGPVGGPRNHKPRPIYNEEVHLTAYEHLILMGPWAANKNIASGMALDKHHNTGPIGSGLLQVDYW